MIVLWSNQYDPWRESNTTIIAQNCTPLREVSIMKRGAIEENHCLIQESPFDVRNFFSIIATP